jgi:hypothetical protein
MATPPNAATTGKAQPASPGRGARRQHRRVGHWFARAAVECLRLGGTAAELHALAAVAEALRRRPPG